jgi:general secretion pathway protein G
MSHGQKEKKSGFTLIEMLVVIAIIGLLSSTILIGLSSARARARDAKRIADMKQIQNGLEAYHSDSGVYPDEEYFYNTMQGIPQEPQGGQYHYYKEGADKYVLGICLENDRGTDIQSYVPGENDNWYEVGPVNPPPERVNPPTCSCNQSPNAYCVTVGFGGR